MSTGSSSYSDASESSYVSAHSIFNSDESIEPAQNSRDSVYRTSIKDGSSKMNPSPEVVTISSSPEQNNYQDGYSNQSSPTCQIKSLGYKSKKSKFKGYDNINETPMRKRPVRQCTLRPIDYRLNQGLGTSVCYDDYYETTQIKILSIKELRKIHDELADKAAIALRPVTKFVQTIKNQIPHSEGLEVLDDLKNAGDRCFGHILDDCNTFVKYARSTTLMLDRLDVDHNPRYRCSDVNWSSPDCLSS